MKIVINEKYNALSDFIHSVPDRIARGEGEVIHSGRNQVLGFKVNGIDLTVKRYKPVNFFQQIAYTYFCKTKAEKSYRFAKFFREHGIDTPEEVAYIEMPQGIWFKWGYFISLRSDYAPAYPALVATEDYDKELAEGIAQMLAKMHRNGILHGDLNLGNFLYTKGADGYRFSVIDTNRTKILDHEPTEKQCAVNLNTLTLRRDLFSFIVKKYAILRGLDAETTEKAALKELTNLEKQKQIKYKWKSRLKIS